jgi:predicted permease
VLLLRPIDAARPHDLVRIYTSESHAPRNEMDLLGGSSFADHLDLRRSPQLADLAALMPMSVSVTTGQVRSRAEARAVSDNYFALLGRPMHLGGWTPHRTTDAHEVVVSHRFWNAALGGDSAVIGRRLLLNGDHVAIVSGVTSPDFRGIEPSEIDLHLSFEAARRMAVRPGLLTDRGERSVKLIGRLARGATAQSAESSLSAIMRTLAVEHPETNARRTISVRRATSVIPVELVGRDLYPTAGLVFGATVVMLAIAGVNVAAVLLARAMRRRRELALRISLGASRTRVARQLVTESVVLALLAGVLVLVLLASLPGMADALGAPGALRPDVDRRVLIYAMGVVALSGAMFGIVPALLAMRSDVAISLRDGGTTALPTRARAQWILVGAQIALSMPLLIVSAALLVSLDRQQRIDPGFAVERLVVANFEDPLGVADRDRDVAFTTIAVERLSELAGVVSVSVGSMAPLTGDGMRTSVHIPGYTPRTDESLEIPVVAGGPHLFRTLGIPILRGRERDASDRDTVPRVVVNRAMAERYWPGADPVGASIRLGGPRGTLAPVIGVAADARFRSLGEAPQPMFVVQHGAGGIPGGGAVMIRTSGDAEALLLAVRGTMSRNDVPFSLMRVQTMEEILRGSLGVSRAVSGVLLATGVLAIALAAIGLYGVVSYVTAGRAREFGVRMALGATPSSIRRLVLGYGVRVAILGGGTGLILGLGALRAMEGSVFGAWTYAPVGIAVGVALCAVTILACALPAMRATSTPPSTALRS